MNNSLYSFYCKYSPNPWSVNSSHSEKAWKSGNSILMFHAFGECLPAFLRIPRLLLEYQP